MTGFENKKCALKYFDELVQRSVNLQFVANEYDYWFMPSIKKNTNSAVSILVRNIDTSSIAENVAVPKTYNIFNIIELYVLKHKPYLESVRKNISLNKEKKEMLLVVSINDYTTETPTTTNYSLRTFDDCLFFVNKLYTTFPENFV